MARDGANRGRPRQPETDDRILQATLAVLREQGPGAVNMVAVSRRSGVAKTTIYRRYSDRDDLLQAALRTITHRGAPSADLSLQGKLRWVLEQARDVLATGVGPGGVAAVLTHSDPEFGHALRSALTSALEPIRTQIADEIREGHLSSDADPDILLNLVLGAYLGELLRYGEVRPTWLDRTARLLGTALDPPSA